MSFIKRKSFSDLKLEVETEFKTISEMALNIFQLFYTQHLCEFVSLTIIIPSLMKTTEAIPCPMV